LTTYKKLSELQD